MVFTYSLMKIETEGVNPETSSAIQECIISQLRSPLGCNLSFFLDNQDLLVYFLLAGANFVIKDVKKETRDGETSMFSLYDLRLKMNKVQCEEAHDGQDSNDTLLPGLDDDTALDILAWSSRSDYPKFASLNKKFKSLIDSEYLYKLRRRLGVIEHWVYLACILMPWEVFDPVRRRWMRLPRMPCDECFTYADKESLAVGTQLLVFGHELAGFAILMYCLLTRVWSRCTLMNLPRCLFGSSSLGEIAVVAGGSDKNGCILKSAELYDSELGTWQGLPDMNLPRKLCSGFFMDGKFYVVGGMSSLTESLTCGEEYNMETRTWRRIENMYPGPNVGTEPAMRSPPLVAVVNNQLYSADQTTNEVKKYNKANNSWSVVKRLPVRADSSNGWGLAFKACGNSLLVIGGHRGSEGEVIVLHSWDPEAARSGEGPDWNVLSIRDRAGSFVYNCAVMGC